MRYSKMLLGLVLGVASLSAQDRWDLRQDYRDLSRDHYNVDRLRYQIAQDQARLNEDIRCGRRWAAAADQRQLDRDRWALRAQWRDIRHDREDVRRDYWR